MCRLSTVQKELKLIMAICMGVAERWMGLKLPTEVSTHRSAGLNPGEAS
jgi:hypothetical protein